MKTLQTLLLCASLCALAPSAFADSRAEIAELKAAMQDMLNRIEALESENAALRSSDNKAEHHSAQDIPIKTKPAAAWSERVALKGDLRYRYEGFDIDGRDDRSRSRIRARLQANAALTDSLSMTIGVATGSNDPVSANQTLGSGGSSKNINLDLAYFAWAFAEDWKLMGGKYKNVWLKPSGSQLIWDDDYNPEGFALTWAGDRWFMNSAYQWLESDSGSDNELALYGIQGGIQTGALDGMVTVGAGHYRMATEGHEVFFGDADEFGGNSFTCANFATLDQCEYDQDYDLTQLFARWSGSVGDLPLSFFAEYVNNADAKDFDTAWAAGASIGKVSHWNTWQFDYRYQDLEEDAVFALLTNSNFGGGGTGSEGHIFQGRFGINKAWQLRLTYFMNEQNVIGGSNTDYDRIQLDSRFKF